MFIKKLSLENWTNYEKEEFNFSDKINVLYGGNAQGKTNAVEGVFYLSTGYSQKKTNDKNLLTLGKDKGNLALIAQTRYGEVSIEAKLYAKEKKKILLNGVEVKKIGELMGNVSTVFFSPSSLRVVSDAPEDRRRFMDMSISQYKRSYFYALQKYSKIILQRNNLLKTQNYPLIKDTLPIWDMQLAPVAGRIISDRLKFLKELAPKARYYHAYLTDDKEDLQVGFESDYYGEEKDIVNDFLQDLTLRVDGDIEKGYTSIGPHRDDLKLMVNGKSVKHFGSQGQQRTTALALKLAEVEIFKEKHGESPILILDDVFSELDKTRQKKLVEVIKNMQTLITCAYLEEDIFEGVEYKKFKIEEGKRVE